MANRAQGNLVEYAPVALILMEMVGLTLAMLIQMTRMHMRIQMVMELPIIMMHFHLTRHNGQMLMETVVETTQWV